MSSVNISEYLSTHPNASILLLGYGKEGQSTHRYLYNNFSELEISIADQNENIEPLFSVKQSLLGQKYLDQIEKFDIIFRTPSISINNKRLQQALQQGKVITSEMNLFFSLLKNNTKTIGVTGTKGKSTTSSLIAHFLSSKYSDVRLVGNIGSPALDQLKDIASETIFVIELSSYQLEDLEYSPNIAVLLGISEEHLDHHGSLENYIDAKKHIFKYQTESDVLIYDEDNEITKKVVTEAKSKKIGFSPSSFLLVPSIAGRKQESYTTVNPKLIGKAYVANILAASAVTQQFGISNEHIQEAIKTFQPLSHRLEFIGEKNGIKFYDDSISTIPDAAINAIEALPEVETLIAGGFDRGIEYENFGKYLAISSIKNVILFNPSGRKIAESMEKYRTSDSPKIFLVESMEQAVNLALQYTEVGKICLLSPASASFGMFKDYIDRGNQFRTLLGFTPSQMK